jgi:hypothetical protein
MEKLKALSYKTLRPWVLASVALGGVFAAGAAATSLASNGRQVMALVLFALTAMGLWVASREEQLAAWRVFARNELDALRTEVSNALQGSGDNYAWFKDVPYRPAFDTLVSSTRDQIGTLELRAQACERQMKERRPWHGVKAIREQWEVIHFEAHRTVQSLTDHLWWSQAGEWNTLASAMSEDDTRRPQLKLVVVNRS